MKIPSRIKVAIDETRDAHIVSSPKTKRSRRTIKDYWYTMVDILGEVKKEASQSICLKRFLSKKIVAQEMIRFIPTDLVRFLPKANTKLADQIGHAWSAYIKSILC